MTQPRVLVLNGPNLNFLGTREPALYGSTTLEQVNESLVRRGDEAGVTLDCRQSNSEGVLIDVVQEAMSGFDAVIINAGGLSHTSIALHDALAMLSVPIVEVHVTNIHAREAFRHHSFVSAVATAIIVGAGTNGYLLALEHVLSLLHVAPPQKQSGSPGGAKASILLLNRPDVVIPLLEQQLQADANQLGVLVDYRQAADDADIVDAVRRAGPDADAIIVRVGALSSSSPALHDALQTLTAPVIEISEVDADGRASPSQPSLISPIASAVLAAGGAAGYGLALRQAAYLVAEKR